MLRASRCHVCVWTGCWHNKTTSSHTLLRSRLKQPATFCNKTPHFIRFVVFFFFFFLALDIFDSTQILCDLNSAERPLLRVESMANKKRERCVNVSQSCLVLQCITYCVFAAAEIRSWVYILYSCGYLYNKAITAPNWWSTWLLLHSYLALKMTTSR